MGRSAAASRSRSVLAEDATLPAEPVGLELMGVGLCLTGALLAAALFTLAPTEAEGAFRNVTGPLGRTVATAFARGVGVGAWVFPLAALAWGISCVRGRSPRRWGGRVLLLPLAAALIGAQAALLMGSRCPPGLERWGPGGYVGLALAVSLFRGIGAAATPVLLVGLGAVLRFLVAIPVKPLLGRALASLDFFGRGTGRGPEEGDEDEAAEAEEDEDEVEYEYEYEYEDEEEEEEEAEPPRDAPLPQAPAPATPPPPRHITRPRLTKKKKKKKAPRREVGAYVFPPTALLCESTEHDPLLVKAEVEANAKVLGQSLASFGVEARVVSSQRGPVITFYEIAIASGIRLNRVTALADDLAIALKAPSVRIVAPIPGRSTVGIEVPNLTREAVMMRELVEENADTAERKALPIYLGRDTAGNPLIEDLATMPHLLIAGATGSGKSVCINSILLSMLYAKTPDEVGLILIDPKQVELSFFEGIPHLLTPVVTDMKRAAKILEWAVDRMEDRYGLLLAGGVRNIAGYNALPPEKHAAIRERTGQSEDEAPDQLPQLVIVVDELADLMMTNGKEVELAITRLAQKSRAVGIHIILATQRPSTNVITGLIKANMPTRIAFCVSSKIDSRVILDANGADKLLGMGDMLYMSSRSLHLRRAQGTLVTDAEVRGIVDYLKEHGPEPDYQDLLQQKREGAGDPMLEDDLYDDAVRAVLSTRLGSASMLQRRLSIGYTRASRLVDMMCDHGVVGPHVGSKARECLYTLEEWEAQRALEQGQALAPSTVFNDDDDDEIQNIDETWD